MTGCRQGLKVEHHIQTRAHKNFQEDVLFRTEAGLQVEVSQTKGGRDGQTGFRARKHQVQSLVGDKTHSGNGRACGLILVLRWREVVVGDKAGEVNKG